MIILTCEVRLEVEFEHVHIAVFDSSVKYGVVRNTGDGSGSGAVTVYGNLQSVNLTDVDVGVAVLGFDLGPSLARQSLCGIVVLIYTLVTGELLPGRSRFAEAVYCCPTKIRLGSRALKVIRTVHICIITLSEYEVLLGSTEEGVVDLKGSTGGCVVQVEACVGKSFFSVLNVVVGNSV